MKRVKKPTSIRLGKTYIRTNGLGLGCCFDNPKDDPEEIIKVAYEMGVRYFDTAPVYKSEVYIGNLIKNNVIDRSKIYISTKTKDISVDGINKSISESCRQLNTDYIDILWLHSGIDSSVQYKMFKDNVLYLKDLLNVKYIGISGHDYKAAEAAIKDNLVDAIMVPHNILYRDFEDLIKVAKFNSIGVVTFKNFASGILIGGPENRFGVEMIKDLMNFEIMNDFSDIIIPSVRSVEQLRQIVKLFKEEDDGTDYDLLERYLKMKLGKVCVSCHKCRPCEKFGWEMSQPRILKLLTYYTRFHLKEAKEEYKKIKLNIKDCADAGCYNCFNECPQFIDIVQWMYNANTLMGE
ncbi:aldo/keto reductase [Thermosipho sp. (in: thermotogales)]|jgi:predicted aldo/keto reductase-like oxidoreductase|uniref:aldo/keto reductase n=1 Tax=Thermosipho sp. (in: thermotogales) TaxID=1968895 RepID=UPI00257FB1C9|nr:aldo/keto reductase [Thermosipho sp. (in: thermotogales)]MBZ4649279.1 aldo/keto reductase [Thermosipho sp. (in: thermotogales)]